MTSGESNATFSPGCTCRLATMPVSGDVAIASFSALRAICTCASADFMLPWATLKLDSKVSNAFCEMKFCLSSAPFVVRFFSASASCAFADSSAPIRSISFDSRSAVSMRARSWPAWTVSPSRTVIWRTSPDTLALTVAWWTGCTVPETGSQRAMGLASTRARSPGVNSSVTVCCELAESAPFFTRRIATVPPIAPMTSIATAIATTRLRVHLKYAMRAP